MNKSIWGSNSITEADGGLVTSTRLGEKRGLDFNNINSSQVTSYNVQETVSNTAYIRGAPVYNFLPANFREFTASGGSASIFDREFKVSSGTTVGGYGAIQSFRSVNMEYGQTALCRFAARFPSAVANSWQGCGLISITDEMSFGYDGLDFGIWYRHNGEVEVRTLTITVAASGAETVTVTINGTPYNISVSAASTSTNAKTIADYLNTNATGYFAEQISNTVVISASTDGPKSNTWSFSSTGTCAASFARTTEGVTKVSEHVPLSEFNGVVPEGFDPSKGNLYSISYGAGYSDIEYRIFDPAYGRFRPAHAVRTLNTVTSTTLNNPTMRCGLYVVSTGSTTNIDTYCAFISAFAQGSRESTRNPRAFRNNKSVQTTLTNILTIRNKRIYNGYPNQVEIEPLSLTVTNEGNKALIVELRTNPTVAGTTNFININGDLVSEYEIAGTTVTENSGTLLAAFTVAAADSESIDLKKLEIRIPPTLRLTVCAKQIAGANAADVTATLIWREDI